MLPGVFGQSFHGYKAGVDVHRGCARLMLKFDYA